MNVTRKLTVCLNFSKVDGLFFSQQPLSQSTLKLLWVIHSNKSFVCLKNDREVFSIRLNFQLTKAPHTLTWVSFIMWLLLIFIVWNKKRTLTIFPQKNKKNVESYVVSRQRQYQKTSKLNCYRMLSKITTILLIRQKKNRE